MTSQDFFQGPAEIYFLDAANTFLQFPQIENLRIMSVIYLIFRDGILFLRCVG